MKPQNLTTFARFGEFLFGLPILKLSLKLGVNK